MELNLICMFFVGVIVLNFVVAFLSPFADYLLNVFIMRGESKEWFYTIQRFKYKDLISSNDIFFKVYMLIVGDVLLLGTIGTGAYFIGTVNYTISPLWLLIPASPFIARFVVDVCRTLKLKNGESQRIKELENKVSELEK